MSRALGGPLVPAPVLSAVAWPPRWRFKLLFGGVPANGVENVGIQAAQPHVDSQSSEDAPRFGRDAGPQPPLWQDGEVNGLGRLRVSASSREEQHWTKPQGARPGVAGVNEKGPST